MFLKLKTSLSLLLRAFTEKRYYHPAVFPKNHYLHTFFFRLTFDNLKRFARFKIHLFYTENDQGVEKTYTLQDGRKL